MISRRVFMVSALFMICMGCLGVQCQANTLTITAKDSELTFAGEHAGMAFQGTIHDWHAQLILPPNEQPKISAQFDLSSLKTGNRTYDVTLLEGDWFDVENHPTGRFVASQISPSARGFIVSGTLTLKGHSQDNRFELIGSLELGLSASIVVNRLDFAIGLESDPDAEWVSEEIQLKLVIPAR